MKPGNEQFKTAERLQALKHSAVDDAFLSSFRRTLVARMEHDLPLSPRPFVFSLIAKTAVVFASFAVLLGGIGLTIGYASQASDPDSFWYKLKIAAEEIQLNLAERDPLESAALSAKFAQHRLAELAAIEELAQTSTAKENVLKLYYQNLQAVQTALQSISGEPTRQSLDNLLVLEGKIDALDQTLGTLGGDTPTSTIAEARALSLFTKSIVQTMSLQYAVTLRVTVDDAANQERAAALYTRVASRYESLNNTWKPLFQEKIQRIVPDETLSPEKADTYPFTQEEERIVSMLNAARTRLSEIETLLAAPALSAAQTMEIAQTLLAIDHDLASIEVLLK